jgi:hypothetical protein
LQELRQLQQQTGSSGPCSISISNSSVCQVTSPAPDPTPDLQQQQQQQQQPHRQLDVGECLSLEQQQKHAARMRLLLRKDALLRAFAASYALGCLTVLQLAQLHVHCSPYYPHPITLVTAIMEQVDQEQQQQQRLAMQELLQDTESCAGGSSSSGSRLGKRRSEARLGQGSTAHSMRAASGP